MEILEKEGWKLNPNEKIVNAILKRLQKTEGECPCVNPGITKEDRMCPCKEYRENDHCCCKLYIPSDELTLNRQIYNQKILDYIIEFLGKHPYMRFNQMMYILNKTNDYFHEEPWDTYERLKKALQ